MEIQLEKFDRYVEHVKELRTELDQIQTIRGGLSDIRRMFEKSYGTATSPLFVGALLKGLDAEEERVRKELERILIDDLQISDYVVEEVPNGD